jgi:hypothetical protein
VVERSISDLKFVQTNNPIPTIEIDLNSIPEGWHGYDDFVAETLQVIASGSPKMRATFYVYVGQSINFGNLTHSAFIGVAKKENLLEPLRNAFVNANIKCRFGEYINPSTGICEFHIEDGQVWRPIDAGTWYAGITESILPEVTTTDSKSNDNDAESNDNDTEITIGSDSENNSDVVSHAANPRRFRAARADASVGNIRKKIEEIFGLPEGSVKLCGPDGRALRSDATIATLRRRWDEI